MTAMSTTPPSWSPTQQQSTAARTRGSRAWIDEKRWECAWVDSIHNGSAIMFSHTSGDADPAHFAVLGSYGDGQTPPGPRWGWRTEIERPDEDRLLITMTNISLDGGETRAVEVECVRKTR